MACDKAQSLVLCYCDTSFGWHTNRQSVVVRYDPACLVAGGPRVAYRAQVGVRFVVEDHGAIKRNASSFDAEDMAAAIVMQEMTVNDDGIPVFFVLVPLCTDETKKCTIPINKSVQ